MQTVRRARPRNKTINLLGIDPGFASCGVAVVSMDAAGRLVVLQHGVVETEKAGKAARVLVSADNVKRGRAICEVILSLARDYECRAICAEAMCFTRSASVSQKMGITWGVVIATATALDIPLLQETPKEIKRIVAGKTNASKAEVQMHVNKAGHLIETTDEDKQREHVFDALATVMACSVTSEILRMMRGEIRE